jgi:gamma-glutamyltranspeptidase/glutathione hydrolase
MTPSSLPSRRSFIRCSSVAVAGSLVTPGIARSATAPARSSPGAVVGDPVAAKIGEQILRDGGNAIDAAIATAFAACICSPSKCGLGGYGGHAVIGLAGGKKITAIDFNSTAPAAARADMFPLDTNGRVKGNINTTGWLAAGVPGTLAGLELALTRYGTRSVRDVLGPAIAMCEEGVHLAAIKGVDDASLNDPRPDSEQSLNLPREKQRNLSQARLLRTLAQRNSTESFYRGDIAATVAEAFRRHGGLVTKADLAAYHAREQAPLTLLWNGLTLHAAPLPSSSPLLLAAFGLLKALDWPKLSEPDRLHAKVEALRLAWADRITHWGDPEHVQVPMDRLLSAQHAAENAAKITTALKSQRAVPLDIDPSRAGGTVNVSAVDAKGNMIALTLTHGGSYGARVAVPELGLVLGHGMSRFDPRPGLPNSPGPGKRPITNMCPTLISRGGQPVFAVGGAGGTRIPTSIYEVLAQAIGLAAPLETAMRSPRIHTTGTLALSLEKKDSGDTEAFFKARGYTVARAPSAYVSAVTFDPATGATNGLAAGGAA